MCYVYDGKQHDPYSLMQCVPLSNRMIQRSLSKCIVTKFVQVPVFFLTKISPPSNKLMPEWIMRLSLLPQETCMSSMGWIKTFKYAHVKQLTYFIEKLHVKVSKASNHPLYLVLDWIVQPSTYYEELHIRGKQRRRRLTCKNTRPKVHTNTMRIKLV